jgi:hypothetical protein
MRREHNVVIVQPTIDWAVRTLLVQSGVVRRNLIVRDWATDATLLKRAAQEVYSASPQEWPFTAKTELDEMMILDRWLRVHRDEPCCIWVTTALSFAPVGQQRRARSQKVARGFNADVMRNTSSTREQQDNYGTNVGMG